MLRPVVSKTMSWVSTTVTRPSLARRVLTSISVHSSACSGAAAARTERGGEHEDARTHGGHHVIAGSARRLRRRAPLRAQETECGAVATVGYADVMSRAPPPSRTPPGAPSRRGTRRADGRFVYGVTSTRHLLPAVVPVAPAAPRSGAPVPRPPPTPRRPASAPAAAASPAGAAGPVGDGARRRARPPPDRRARRRRSRRPPHAGRARAPPAASARSTCSARSAALVGASPKTYADERRAARLRARLKEGVPVTTATYDVGYGFEPRRLRTGRPPSRHDARRLPPRRRRRAHPRRRRADAVRPAARRAPPSAASAG